VEDEELLRLIVLPRLVEKGVDLKSIVCEDDRSCLRFTLGTAEAKRKLLGMGSLAFTDQIIITFEDPTPTLYPLLVTVRGIQHPTWSYFLSYFIPVGLRRFAAYIRESRHLHSEPVFEKESVVLSKELKLTLNCRSARDAHELLLLESWHITRCPHICDDPWFYGATLRFYEPGLQLLVKGDAKKILCDVEPHIGEAMIKRVTDVRVSVGRPDTKGEVLVTVDNPEDYDVLFDVRKKFIFAGQTINFVRSLRVKGVVSVGRGGRASMGGRPGVSMN
jgi:hypothetical protein